jgi:hypothetical protein
MSVVTFRPFITVTVEEQTTGKPIHALSFGPTAATARRLADHRLIVRPRANGFQIYAKFNPEAGNARLGAFAGRTSLVFGIRLSEADFLARYQPDLDSTIGPNLYLTNRDPDGSVRKSGRLSLGDTVEKADAARIVGRRLNARTDHSATSAAASLKVTDRFDPSRTVANVPVNSIANSGSAAVAIDLSADRAVAYTLAPQPAGNPKMTLFVDDELAGRGAFGALELVAEPSAGPEPAGGRIYSATFRRRS